MELAIAIALLAGLAVGYFLRKASEPDVSQTAKTASAEVVQRLLEENRRDREAEQQLVAAQREAAKAELARREAEMKNLAQPLQEAVKNIERELKDAAKDRGATKAILGQMEGGVKLLASETAGLKQALRKPQIRGRWGETQLRRCVEMAGMTEHVNFETQETLQGEDGRLRPDARFHMPGGGCIVADSKVPLDAYLDAYEAEDETVRRTELERHSRQVREHVKALASRRYQEQFKAGESPDFVVCFIPVEPALQAAFEADPTIWEYALEKKVLIATPTTLIGLLRTVELAWRQERMTEQAQRIADAGRELHSRSAPFLTEIAKLGRALRSAVGAYDSAVGSIEARFLPQLRRFEELGASSGKELEDPVSLDAPVKRVTAPELSAAGGSAADPVSRLPERALDAPPAEAA